MFHNKKGTDMMWIIVLFMVSIAFGIFLLIGGAEGIKKAFASTKERFNDLDDYDNDKIVNIYDKCPCTAVVVAEEEQLQGCPKPTSIAAAQQDQKNFKDKLCPSPTTTPETAAQNAPQASSLQLMDGTVQVPSGTYSTTSTSLSYRASCASTCSFRIVSPSGRASEEGFGTEGTFLLEEFGTEDLGVYQIILLEQGNTKVGYTVERITAETR